jgi:hypothetical protein
VNVTGLLSQQYDSYTGGSLSYRCCYCLQFVC